MQNKFAVITFFSKFGGEDYAFSTYSVLRSLYMLYHLTSLTTVIVSLILWQRNPRTVGIKELVQMIQIV